MINLGVVLCLLAAFDVSTKASITVGITPAAVSNTYSGKITLVIGNLPGGGSVVVQKFLDHNANGVLDAGDMLFQQFTITDGQAGMVIGGATNINVPGDSDNTAGQITCKLRFPDGDFAQTIIGNYLFVFSSPTGAFSPVTNSFAVTNFPFAQKITGSVVENGLNVPGAVVVVFPPPSSQGLGSPVALAVTDGSGNYNIALPPGSYLPLAFGGNAVADALVSPLLNLSTGQTITTNLTLTSATASISGQVVDADNPGVGLPGLFLPVSNKTGLVATTSTDTNGDFTVGVLPGTWKIEGEPTGLALHGYVGYQGGTNVNSGASVTGAFFKATALFYGQVVDELGNPLPNIDVNANDNSGTFQSDGYSDDKGYYSVAALGGLSGDSWYLQAGGGNGGGAPANYIFSQPSFDQGAGSSLGVNQAVLVNFTGLVASNIISGQVRFNGTNVVGVGVFAGVTINGLNYNAYADTDANGDYSFNVANGVWSVGVNQSGGNDSLDAILGGGNYSPPASQNIAITNNNGAADFIIQPPGGGGGPLQINTTSLPNGNVGGNYSTQLQAGGGTLPYSWSLANGSLPLPIGLTLGTNGVISGVPGTNGLFPFIVQVSDANFNSVNQSLGLIINPKPSLSASVRLSNGQFQFLLSGGANQNYTLQMATNLVSPNWITLYVTNNPTANSFLLADPHATNQQRFYRVLVGP